MKIAAVRSNLPERRRVILGSLDLEADAGSVRRESGPVRRARNGSQLMRIGYIGVRLVYVGGLAKYEMAAVG
jgi:hypothetical protein